MSTAAAAVTGRPPAKARGRALGLAARAAVSCLLGATVGFALLLAVPPITGHRSLTVLSGSMEPTLETGSVVVDEVIHPTDARIGDILTFSDPEDRDREITHRLRDVRVRGGTAYMVTRGDANDTGERWSVPVDGKVGRVVLHVPKLGHVRALAGSRNGYLILLFAVLVLGAWVLVDVWRPRR
jgi:signal peptidase